MASPVCNSKSVFDTMRASNESSSDVMDKDYSSLETDDTDDETADKRNVDSLHSKKTGKFYAFKVWHVRLRHEIPLKVIKRRINYVLLPHLTCPTTDRKTWLAAKFCLRFEGSLTRLIKIRAIHLDTNGSIDVKSVHGTSIS